jgi:hypothetical protein
MVQFQSEQNEPTVCGIEIGDLTQVSAVF